MIIDSHQHFWKYHPVKDAWITDDMKRIQQDFLPADLAPILKKNAVAGCIAVQADESEKETEFLLEQAAANKCVKGVVGWVNLRAVDVEARLSFYKENHLFKGVRHLLQSEPDDFVLNKQFLNGIATLSRFNLTYDILIHPKQLQNTAKMVAKFSNTKFIIDHLAKPYIKTGAINTWKKDIEQIAKYPNVYCKLSGFVTEADVLHWKYEDFIPYFDTLCNAFGSHRILFGSDWPVCLLAAEYTEVLHIVKRYLKAFSSTEQEAILGANAAKFYAL